MAAVVAVVVMLVGGGITAVLVVGGGSDDDAATSGSSDDPTAPNDPATPAADPTDPAASPVDGDLWETVPSDAEVNQVADGLEANGYACYDTAGPAMLTSDEPVTVDGQPVLVRRCYLEPASGRDQEQTISLQAAPDGSVNAVRVIVNAFLDKSDQRTSRWFGAAMRGLTGTVLQPSEARALAAGQATDIAWGKADLYTNHKHTSYRLELIADGSDIQTVPAGSTGLSIQDVRAHYSGAEFTCRVEPQTLVCEQTRQGYLLRAIAFDHCFGASAPRTCPDSHTVGSLTLQAEFDAGMPERAYTPIFEFLVTGALPFAYQDAWSSEVDSTFGALDVQKPHLVDIEGLHVSFFPFTTASFETDFDQAYQVVIEGICATDC